MAEPFKQLTKRLRVSALCSNFSTRFLLETSMNAEKHELVFCDNGMDFSDAFQKHTSDIYIIDTAGKDREENMHIFKVSTEMEFKGLRRIVLIVMDILPETRNRMMPYGPLCFIEVAFTRARLESTFREVMELRDTGVRVKMDEDFFDITKMKK